MCHVATAEFVKAVEDAVAKGIKINRKLAHSIITGPTGSGKSSLVRRLLSLPFIKFSKSTGVAEGIMTIQMGELNPTTFHSATAVGSDAWEELQYELSLVNQMGQTSAPVPANSQSPADPTSSASAEAQPAAAEVVKSKPRESKGFKIVQFFRRKGKSARFGKRSQLSSPSSPEVVKRETVTVIAISSENIVSVIKKYGFDAVMKYFKQTSTLYLRDTGGQVEFQEMLPLLIYGPSIFIFVFRADLDFQSKLRFEYRESEGKSLNSYTSSITTEEALLQCLASVYAMDTSEKDVIKTHKSLVLIVGTHIDQLGSLEEQKQKIHQLNQHIHSVITKNGFRDLVQYADESSSSVMFPVDNSSESDEGFRAIRYQINSLVSHREEFAIDYPVKYLLVSLDLQHVKKTFLSLEEFKVLAAKHSIVGDEIFPLLQFLHLRVGVIRYYNVDGLRDIIVLEPQVLFNSVTTLIVKTFSCEALADREVKEYKEKGVLAASAFESVLSTVSEPRPHSPRALSASPVADVLPSRHGEQSQEEAKRGILPASAFEAIRARDLLSPKKFLQLLVQLRIIAPFPTAGDQEEKYFIPCVLNHVPESSLGDHPHTDVCPLAVQFLCQHCPKGVFGVLVTHLMAPEPSRSSHGITTTFTLMQDKIFKDQVFFAVRCTGVRDMISLKVLISHLEVRFFPGSLEYRSLSLGAVCEAVREVIQARVDESLQDLHYNRGKLEPSVCFRCESCSELHPVFEGISFKFTATRTTKPAACHCKQGAGTMKVNI